MDKKEAIRLAAIKVFAENGFHKTTTDSIAEEAEVAVGTIYNYFQNKQDVLEHIFAVEYEKREYFYEKLKQKDLHPVEKISQIIEKHFTEVKENPELIKIILTERHLARSCFPKREGLRRFMEEIIVAGKKEGTISDIDPEILAVMLFGTIEAVMAEYLAREGERDRGDIFNRAQQEIVKLLKRGLSR